MLDSFQAVARSNIYEKWTSSAHLNCRNISNNITKVWKPFVNKFISNFAGKFMLYADKGLSRFCSVLQLLPNAFCRFNERHFYESVILRGLRLQKFQTLHLFLKVNERWAFVSTWVSAQRPREKNNERLFVAYKKILNNNMNTHMIHTLASFFP